MIVSANRQQLLNSPPPSLKPRIIRGYPAQAMMGGEEFCDGYLLYLPWAAWQLKRAAQIIFRKSQRDGEWGLRAKFETT